MTSSLLKEPIISNDLINNKIELFSFDIFDTLITRKTATPKGIFALMQKRIIEDKNIYSLPTCLLQNFYKLRIEIEQYLRANYKLENINEITIDEIYDFIQKNYHLSQEAKNYLLRLEIETEKENLIPIRERIDEIKKLINSGSKVILLSDMYLTASHLKEILCHIDPIFQYIKIYSSADTKMPKHNGSAYQYIKEMEGVEFSKWLHVGDNANADILNAQKYKIQTKQVYFAKLKDYEQAILKGSEADTFVQLTIGTAKNTRLFNTNKNLKKEFGISLGAPLLFTYIAWITEQAVKLGITRLYFIARDGFILKQMTDKLIQAQNLPIKTYYIYGSRKAWRMSALSEKNFDISYIFNETWSFNTIETLAERFNLEKHIFEEFIPNKYQSYKKILKSKDIETLKNSLINNDGFKNLIISKNTKQRETLLKYIKQEFDFSDDNFAIVDLQGTANTQKLFASLLNEVYSKPIKCFYYKVAVGRKTENDKFVKIYMQHPNSSAIIGFLEVFCRAFHGQTVGYKEDSNGKIRPILQQTGSALEAWGYNEFVEGICEFCNNYCYTLKHSNIIPTDLKISQFYQNYLVYFPSKETVEIIGSIPFSHVGNDDDVSECAPAYTLKDFFNYKNRKLTIHSYSMKRSTKLIQKLMNFRSKNPNLLSWILSIHISKRKNKSTINIKV